MKVSESKDILLQEKLFFIKNLKERFNLIEIDNEFGIEDKKVYIEYLKNYILNNQLTHKYILFTFFSNVRIEKLVDFNFKCLLKKINLANFIILEKYNIDKYKRAYLVKIENTIDKLDFEELFNVWFSFIELSDKLSNYEIIKFNNEFDNIQFDYEYFIQNLKHERLNIISNFSSSDGETYFIITKQ